MPRGNKKCCEACLALLPDERSEVHLCLQVDEVLVVRTTCLLGKFSREEEGVPGKHLVSLVNRKGDDETTRLNDDRDAQGSRAQPERQA